MGSGPSGKRCCQINEFISFTSKNQINLDLSFDELVEKRVCNKRIIQKDRIPNFISYPMARLTRNGVVLIDVTIERYPELKPGKQANNLRLD
ncbi:hypothetical protein M413DRAFT_276555 [Hebeloma cylindrosporum]|uniref:Uncharacterized protein n=1 Tax=Hebeloma cylindrosporum TaxID=76867 RepID=A0A0C3C0T3_HEBCY|nr:hypothetical protein M413DRAFT_276555 [Hebeloma cylindrosporum h7]